MTYKVFILLIFIVEKSFTHQEKSMMFKQLLNIRYECLDVGCSSSSTISVSTMKDCMFSCLFNDDCRTLVYDQSSQLRQWFIDSPNQYGILQAQSNFITLTVADEIQLSTCKFIRT